MSFICMPLHWVWAVGQGGIWCNSGFTSSIFRRLLRCNKSFAVSCQWGESKRYYFQRIHWDRRTILSIR